MKRFIVLNKLAALQFTGVHSALQLQHTWLEQQCTALITIIGNVINIILYREYYCNKKVANYLGLFAVFQHVVTGRAKSMSTTHLTIRVVARVHCNIGNRLLLF